MEDMLCLPEYGEKKKRFSRQYGDKSHCRENLIYYVSAPHPVLFLKMCA